MKSFHRVLFLSVLEHIKQQASECTYIYSHLIPTIERENLDLQDPHIAKWNKELLLSVGQIARFIYDQIMSSDNFQSTNKRYDATLASYSFQPSVPNNEIGMYNH